MTELLISIGGAIIIMFFLLYKVEIVFKIYREKKKEE